MCRPVGNPVATILPEHFMLHLWGGRLFVLISDIMFAPVEDILVHVQHWEDPSFAGYSNNLFNLHITTSIHMSIYWFCFLSFCLNINVAFKGCKGRGKGRIGHQELLINCLDDHWSKKIYTPKIVVWRPLTSAIFISDYLVRLGICGRVKFLSAV